MINSDVLRIMLARGSGEGTLKKINNYFEDNVEYSLHDICENQRALCSLGIAQDVAENIVNSRESAFFMQEQLNRAGVDMYWIGDKDYPAGLKKLKRTDMPGVLFCLGNFNLLQKKTVGFTGSRNVSDSGIAITDKAAKQFAAKDVVVVSGYAKGVDITAHRSSLQNGGSTVFVIAEGILRKQVKRDIKDLLNDNNHLFISQFLPNSAWSSSNAMKRNNTIIGLSDAMLMIESRMDGGTYNAGKQCIRNKKPLFVVEYGISKPSAEGNVYFLQNGGTAIRGDREGNPNLKKIFSELEKKDTNDDGEPEYMQLKLKLG